MIQNEDLSYSEYSGSDVYLDSSNNLVFSTLNPLSLTMFIEASNPSAGSQAYLPVYLTVNNFAPYFVEGPPSNVQITAGETFSYSIPSFSDNEGANVTLSISGLDETFMLFDELTQTIEIME